MELSSFSQNIVTVPYVRGDETVELSVNIDAFTPDFFREMGKRFDEKLKGVQAEAKKKKSKGPQVFEDEARALEVSREIYADLLSSGVLTGWTITENDVPVAPTKDVLMKLPPRLISELWEICKGAASTVKKTGDGGIEATSESMPSGSRGLHAVGQSG